MIKGRINVYDSFLKIDKLYIIDSNGNQFQREIMMRRDGVASVIYDTIKEKFVFISQWRPASDTKLIEIVAGMLDYDDEPLQNAIKREIEEEVGYKIDDCQLINDCYMSPGGTSEKVSIFFCTVSEQISKGGGLKEENENIEIIYYTLNELLNIKFNDAKTIIGVDFIKFNLNKFKK